MKSAPATRICREIRADAYVFGSFISLLVEPDEYGSADFCTRIFGQSPAFGRSESFCVWGFVTLFRGCYLFQLKQSLPGCDPPPDLPIFQIASKELFLKGLSGDV